MDSGRGWQGGARIPAARAFALALGAVLAVSIGCAYGDLNEMADPETVGDRLFLVARMMSIHREMGLACGCTAAHEAEATEAGVEIDSVYAFAKRQTRVLVVEAERRLERGARHEDVPDFLAARTAGYRDVAEMRRDLARVLGPARGGEAASLYLVLRRMERYGLVGRQRDFERLRAELRALGVPPAVSDLQRLLDARWRRLHGPPASSEPPAGASAS